MGVDEEKKKLELKTKGSFLSLNKKGKRSTSTSVSHL